MRPEPLPTSSPNTIKNRVSELEEQVAKGGDEGLKAQLAQAQAELNSTKNQFNTLKANFDKAKTDHAKALNDFKIEAEIAKAKEGLTFKKGLSEPVMNTLVAQAVANVKAKNPSFEDRNGVSTLVFHDDNGAPLNNAENKLNPFTARELLVKEFESMDILETMPAKGAGGKPRVTAPSVSLWWKPMRPSPSCSPSGASPRPRSSTRRSTTKSGTRTTMPNSRSNRSQRVRLKQLNSLTIKNKQNYEFSRNSSQLHSHQERET